MIIGAVVILLFHKLRQPLILGYIIAGIIIGTVFPYVQIISDIETIESIAELGIIMLLFALGLTFSFSKLRNVGWIATVTGIVLIISKIALGYLLGIAFNWSELDAFFLGTMIAISSTAVITKTILDKGLIHERSSQIIIGILIIEDIAAVIILTILSGIAITGEFSIENLINSVLYISFFIFILLAFGFLLAPRIIEYAAGTRSREIILITALGLCFGFAVFGYYLGLSLAIGAFVCGVVLGETREGKNLHENVRPLKDMFSAIFFISIGMLFDINAVFTYWNHIVIITVAFTIFTIILDTTGPFLFGVSARTALNVGLTMCVLGEFSFIIAHEGYVSGVISSSLFPIMVSVSVITLIINSYISKYSASITNYLEKKIPVSFKRYLAFITLQLNAFKLSMNSSETISDETKDRIKSIIVDIVIIITALFMLRLVTYYSESLIEFVGLSEELEDLFMLLLFFTALVVILTATIAIAKSSFRIIEMASLPLYIRNGSKRKPGEVIAYQIFRGLAVMALMIISTMFLIFILVIYLSLSPLFLLIVAAVILMFGYLLHSSVEGFNEKIKVVLLKGIMGPKEPGGVDKEVPESNDLPITEILAGGDMIRNIPVGEGSPYSNRLLSDLDIRKKMGASVIGIRRESQLIINPGADEMIQDGDVLILLGSRVHER